jgi:hypothetical protein
MEKNNLLLQIEEAFNKKPHLGAAQGIRKMKKGRPNKRIIKFFSRKNNTHIPCESRLEASHALLLEFTHSVTRYRSQPFRLHTEKSHYVPDSLIETEDGLYELREIKPKARLESDKVSHKLREVSEKVTSYGVDFRTVDETQLNSQPQKHNREYLYRHTRCEFSNHVVSEAIQYLPKITDWPKRLGELRLLLDKKFDTQGLADELIRLDELTHDPRAFLSVKTPISRVGGDQ